LIVTDEDLNGVFKRFTPGGENLYANLEEIILISGNMKRLAIF